VQAARRHVRPGSVTPAGAADPWSQRTGLVPGSVLGDLVGREWDSIPAYLPESCQKPGLTVLFHRDGASGPADAVRYTAPSGARVFSSGSLQFSWALDTFGLTAQGHAEGPDPRVQQFVRNVFADELQQAPAVGLAAVPHRWGVVLAVAGHPDPRIRAYAIVRHPGRALFDPTGTDTRAVCRNAAGSCVDHLRGRGIYRYAATALDSWGASPPAFSAPVRVEQPRRARKRPR